MQFKCAEFEKLCRKQEHTINHLNQESAGLSSRLKLKDEQLQAEKARSQSLKYQLDDLGRAHSDLQQGHLALRQQLKRASDDAADRARELERSARALDDAARAADSQAERTRAVEDALRAAEQRRSDDARRTALLEAELAAARRGQLPEASAALRTRQLVLDGLAGAMAAVPAALPPFGPPLADGFGDESDNDLPGGGGGSSGGGGETGKGGVPAGTSASVERAGWLRTLRRDEPAGREASGGIITGVVFGGGSKAAAAAAGGLAGSGAARRARVLVPPRRAGAGPAGVGRFSRVTSPAV